MKEKSKLGLQFILIFFLIVIIIGLLGVLISISMSNNKNNSNDNKTNNSIVEDNGLITEENKIKDLEEAKKLVNKYLDTPLYWSIFGGLSEDFKLYMSIYTFVSCNDNSCEYPKTVAYNDLNTIYKDLFGQDAPKIDIDFPNIYNYNNDQNSWVDTGVGAGFAGIGPSVYGIESFSYVKDLLLVETRYYQYDSYDEESGCYYSEFNDCTKYEDAFDKQKLNEFYEKNKENFSKYYFIFEYKDNHYVLKNLIKVVY